jgi:hypothetical protein
MLHMVQMIIWILNSTLLRRTSKGDCPTPRNKQTSLTFSPSNKITCNVCFWMCQMYLFIYIYNRTENLSNLDGINSDVILNVIKPNLGYNGLLLLRIFLGFPFGSIITEVDCTHFWYSLSQLAQYVCRNIKTVK